MNDMRGALETIAHRGTTRGADAVRTAAVDQARQRRQRQRVAAGGTLAAAAILVIAMSWLSSSGTRPSSRLTTETPAATAAPQPPPVAAPPVSSPPPIILGANVDICDNQPTAHALPDSGIEGDPIVAADCKIGEHAITIAIYRDHAGVEAARAAMLQRQGTAPCRLRVVGNIDVILTNTSEAADLVAARTGGEVVTMKC
jgi:hypothetical protein